MEIRSLGRYEVRGRIGRGTMGVVYRGYDPVLDRDLALKAVDLPPALDEAERGKFLERFFQEAKIAAKLLHPGIVVTHDASTDEATGIPFIAMELVPGGSLGDRIGRDGPMSWQEACRLAVPLARALDYAHREGVVHRDIKPANVLVALDGSPKVADFGIAKLADSHLTQTGAVLGTPYYMSPEQIEGDDVDGRSDLFSLGSLFYALLVGEPPFRGPDLATITRQVLHKSPQPPSEAVAGVPPSLDGVVGRALAKLREDRYATGAELAEDLERVGRGEAPLRPLAFGERTLESRTKKTRNPEPEPARASSARLGFLLLLLAASIGAAALFHWRELTAYVSAGLSRAEATMRERNEEAERREALALAASARLDDGEDLLARGDFEGAALAFEESIRLSRDAVNGEGEARAILWRGRLAAESGDWSRARADLESAAAVFEIYHAPAGAAEAAVERAHLERDLGAFDQAEGLYDRAAFDATVRFDVALGRAILDLLRDDVAAAEAGFQRVLEGARREEVRAQAASYLAALAFAEGEADEAERLWARAEEGMGKSRVDLFRGYAALASGRVDESKALFESSEAYFRAKGHETALASALDGLAERTADGPLQTVLLGEPRTKRNDERRGRLPVPKARP